MFSYDLITFRIICPSDISIFIINTRLKLYFAQPLAIIYCIVLQIE